jgi:hypothetical protein
VRSLATTPAPVAAAAIAALPVAAATSKTRSPGQNAAGFHQHRPEWRNEVACQPRVILLMTVVSAPFCYGLLAELLQNPATTQHQAAQQKPYLPRGRRQLGDFDQAWMRAPWNMLASADT